MKSKKPIIILILSLVMIGVAIFCISWFNKNKDKFDDVVDGASLYTKAELDSAYDEGYEKAKKEYKAEIERLKAQVKDLETKNTASKEEIADLSERIAILEKNIAMYENLLGRVEEATEDFLATFLVENEIYSLKLYAPGTTVDVPDPVPKEGYIFAGWQVNGELVDVPGYIINDTTEFKAIFHCVVTFNVDGAEYAVKHVAEGAKVTLPATPVKEGFTFVGWSLDGENVVDLKSKAIDGPVTYKAIFEVTYNHLYIKSYEVLETGSQRLKMNVGFFNDVVVHDGQEIYCQGNPAKIMIENGSTYLLAYMSSIWEYYCLTLDSIGTIDLPRPIEYTTIDLYEKDVVAGAAVSVSIPGQGAQSVTIETGKEGYIWITLYPGYEVSFTKLGASLGADTIHFSEPQAVSLYLYVIIVTTDNNNPWMESLSLDMNISKINNGE